MPQRTAGSGGKVKYSGLPAGSHTWIDEPVPCVCKGKAPGHASTSHTRTNHTRIEPGQVVATGDLEDGSRRSRLIKDHLDRGVCAPVGGGGS